jgi:hypothetical protein
MMTAKRVFWLFAVAAILAAPRPARASAFTLHSYTVTLNQSDPGLVLYETPLLDLSDPTKNPFTLSNQGDHVTTTLFRLGTHESALNLDDLRRFDIDVAFDFSTPPPAFGGSAQGVTGAAWLGQSFGYVAWDKPMVTMAFGDTGLLGVSLTGDTFGLPGSTDIAATFTLVRADAGGGTPAPVPEPASMLLVGSGLALAAKRLRRRSA